MNGLLLHCGGVPASREAIGTVPLPPETDSYQPVAHNLLVDKVVEITTDVLGVTLADAAFGLTKDGQRLFAHLRFKNGMPTDVDMALCVGVVNSYNKSLAVKFAAGGSIFVCDNLVLSGGITYARKHTTLVWPDLEEAILERIGHASDSFQGVVADGARMRGNNITDLCAYRVMGQLYGERLLTSPMMSEARREWDNPTYADFKPRNQWSLYNAITAALKRAQPDQIMEKHQRLHEIFKGSDFQSVGVA